MKYLTMWKFWVPWGGLALLTLSNVIKEVVNNGMPFTHWAIFVCLVWIGMHNAKEAA